MTRLSEPGALLQQFRTSQTLGDFLGEKNAIFSPVKLDNYKEHAKLSAEVALKQSEYDQAGLKSGSVESVHKTSALASKDAQNSVVRGEEETAKQRYDDALFLAMLSDLEGQLADARGQRIGFQEELVEQYGEDFIVDLAERFLDPEHLERQDGESKAEYRARLEEELKDLMLNEDGSIKEGYEDLTIAKYLEAKNREEALEIKIDEAIQLQQLDEQGVLSAEQRQEFIEGLQNNNITANAYIVESLKNNTNDSDSVLVVKAEATRADNFDEAGEEIERNNESTKQVNSLLAKLG